MSRLRLFTCCLALAVIVLGAYTRLTDAGLGCPDWPGCYGHLALPSDSHRLLSIEQQYQQLVEPRKAWTEMIHRYIAGTLLLCIFCLAWHNFKQWRQGKPSSMVPWLVVGVVIFQALLGMWTVTLKLFPPIILLHLFGGFTTLSLLWWYYLSQYKSPSPMSKGMAKAIGVGMLLLILQIALGGWTSANYAALVCPDFPFCQGKLLPAVDLSAFTHSSGIAKDNIILVTINTFHRFGAVVVALYLFWLGHKLLRQRASGANRQGLILLSLLAVQLTLGVLNIVWLLPLSTAVLHNGVAALLLLTLIAALAKTPLNTNAMITGGEA